MAIERGDAMEAVRWLEAGADPNWGGANGVTALMRAVTHPHPEVLLRTLAEHQASLDAPDAAGATPLLWALHERNVPAVRTLLELGADPNTPDGRFTTHTPILEALSPMAFGPDATESSQQVVALVTALVDHGARPDGCNALGDSPLLVVLKMFLLLDGPQQARDAERLVRLVLDAGADLHPLTTGNNPALVELLTGLEGASDSAFRVAAWLREEPERRRALSDKRTLEDAAHGPFGATGAAATDRPRAARSL